MPRPHAVKALYRECPGEDCIIQYGDGSLYRYTAGLTPVLSIRQATRHGSQANLPGVRRTIRFPGAGYLRLGSLPTGVVTLFSDPPYQPIGQPPGCPPPVTCSAGVLSGLPVTLTCPELISWLEAVGDHDGWTVSRPSPLFVPNDEAYWNGNFATNRGVFHNSLSGSCSTPINWDLYVFPRGIATMTYRVFDTFDPRASYSLVQYTPSLGGPDPPDPITVIDG